LRVGRSGSSAPEGVLLAVEVVSAVVVVSVVGLRWVSVGRSGSSEGVLVVWLVVDVDCVESVLEVVGLRRVRVGRSGSSVEGVVEEDVDAVEPEDVVGLVVEVVPEESRRAMVGRSGSLLEAVVVLLGVVVAAGLVESVVAVESAGFGEKCGPFELVAMTGRFLEGLSATGL
jgi:hypothetical protein